MYASTKCPTLTRGTGTPKVPMRATTLATFDDVRTSPETVSPPCSTVLSMCSRTISGGAFAARCGTSETGAALTRGIGERGGAVVAGAVVAGTVVAGAVVTAAASVAIGATISGAFCATVGVGPGDGNAVGTLCAVGVALEGGDGSEGAGRVGAHAVTAITATKTSGSWKRIARITFVFRCAVPPQHAPRYAASKAGRP